MRSALALAVLSLCLAPALAQTYAPKDIRVEGVPASDKAEIIHTLGLQPGALVSKADIEAALQRVADSGNYSDLSYTVNGDALVIRLKAAEGSEALPVRFANFVWWQPGELEPLVEARVPLFHGRLSLTGQLTKDVCTALEALLKEKGIANAKVMANMSTLGGHGEGGNVVALVMTQPDVIVGDIKLTGGAPALQPQLDVVTSKLAGQQFDLVESAAAIRNNVVDTHANGGYLDVTVDEPVFAAPHQDMLSYEVDVTAVVHPGPLYTIEKLDVPEVPPLTQAEAYRATGMRAGSPASLMDFKIAQESLTRAYQARGYLEAHILGVSTRNPATHTVVDHFSIDAGVLDHLSRVDTTALSPDLQAAFAKEWKGTVGMPAGKEMTTEAFRVLRAIGAMNSVVANERINRAQHTVVLMLTPGKS